MAVPTILATEATPLDSSKKRKFQDALDLTRGQENATHIPIVVDNELAHDHGSEMPVLKHSHEHTHGHACNHDHEEDGHGHDHHQHEHEHGSDCDHDHEDEYEDEDEVSESEIMESIMDQVEADPYIPDASQGVTREVIAQMHEHLRTVGLEKFFQDKLSDLDAAGARQLGALFGLDPELDVPDGFYMNVLGAAIVRIYHKRQKLAAYNTLDDVAALLQQCRKILVITGAGVSTSLGIPDFRSRGTGFYDKVRALGYDEPEDVFDIGYFEEKPEIFYSLAGDILPDLQRFSPTHAFIRLLQDKDRLLTNYTQNIDNLEAAAGIDESRIVQCHGSFATATCRTCGHQVKGVEIYPDIRARRVPRCQVCTKRLAVLANTTAAAAPRPVKRSKTNAEWEEDDEDEDDTIPEPGIMKPDITFFGEQLPNTFFDRLTHVDAEQADLVLVIGTSLKVAPVSEMPNYIPHTVPHVYISREPIGHVEFDVQLLGNCDDVVVELCRRCGWELKHDMIPSGFEAEVAPVQGCEFAWSIAQKGAHEGSKAAEEIISSAEAEQRSTEKTEESAPSAA